MDIFDISGAMLMLLLGLRHGLDPDHIAVIDALTLRAATQERRYAPWTGTLFAVGHGMVVTLIATLVSLGLSQVSVPSRLTAVMEWLPVAMLVAVGVLNWRALRRATDYRPTGWLQKLMPRRLMETQSVLGVILVGAIFAAVFDTITQATAWGYVATRSGGAPAGLAAGLVFTLGMLITDTVDSRVLCRALRDVSPSVAIARRRRLGYFIVLMSFGVAAYSVMARLAPTLKASDGWLTAAGAAMVAVVIAIVFVKRTRAASDATVSGS